MPYAPTATTIQPHLEQPSDRKGDTGVAQLGSLCFAVQPRRLLVSGRLYQYQDRTQNWRLNQRKRQRLLSLLTKKRLLLHLKPWPKTYSRLVLPQAHLRQLKSQRFLLPGSHSVPTTTSTYFTYGAFIWFASQRQICRQHRGFFSSIELRQSDRSRHSRSSQRREVAAVHDRRPVILTCV